ncbi:hypothetical protein E2P81_ATG06576 [Venturia nashicola]|nr:hypothetical protein E2P81_ATG06576 [Venturia nashicola]
MSAYFLHQPSRANIILHPSISSSKNTSQQSTPRTSYESTLKTQLVSSSEEKEENKEIGKSTTKKLLKAIQQRWKDHRESVRASHELYYGQGTSTGRALGNPFVEAKKV